MRASTILGWSATLFAALWAGAIVALFQTAVLHGWFWTEPGLAALTAVPTFVATRLAAWWLPIRMVARGTTGFKTAIGSSFIFSIIIAGTVLVGIVVDVPTRFAARFIFERLAYGLVTFPIALVVSLPCSVAGAAVFDMCVRAIAYPVCTARSSSCDESAP
jgi:hypothetical protein